MRTGSHCGNTVHILLFNFCLYDVSTVNYVSTKYISQEIIIRAGYVHALHLYISILYIYIYIFIVTTRGLSVDCFQDSGGFVFFPLGAFWLCIVPFKAC